MAAQKVREKGRKREKMEKIGKAESFPPILLLSQKKKLSVITVQELIYYPSQAKLQKEPKSKAITRDKMGRNKKIVTERQKRETAGDVNSGSHVNSARRKKISHL